jgi:hypothetical protein
MFRFKAPLIAVILSAGALFAGSAQASSIHWSVNVGVPVVVAPRVYAPAPVYYQPAPVYYQPAPVYYQPPPVVVYQPQVTHPGWQHPHHRHHHERHQYRDEYGDRHQRGRW